MPPKLRNNPTLRYIDSTGHFYVFYCAQKTILLIFFDFRTLCVEIIGGILLAFSPQSHGTENTHFEPKFNATSQLSCNTVAPHYLFLFSRERGNCRICYSHQLQDDIHLGGTGVSEFVNVGFSQTCCGYGTSGSKSLVCNKE